MIAAPCDIEAKVFAKLPDALHYLGEPNEWVKTTRPGQRLHSFLEGPCFDANGDLWLVDVPHGRIFRVSPSGNWTLAADYDGEPHSIKPTPDGRFYVADHRLGLLIFDPASGAIETLCARVNTEAFRGLADLAVATNGDVWFSDPGRSNLADPTGRLFRLRAGAREAECVLRNIPYPNGVALSPAGDFVYVAATRANALWRLNANWSDASAPMAGLFVQLSGGLGPDGLAVDHDGSIAVAQARAGRAYIFDALGDMKLRIHTPGGLWTTACCFAPDGRSVFISEAQTGAIYRADL